MIPAKLNRESSMLLLTNNMTVQNKSLNTVIKRKK